MKQDYFTYEFIISFLQAVLIRGFQRGTSIFH